MRITTPLSCIFHLAITASGIVNVVASASLATVSTVVEFAEGTWLENLAVRSNGQILVSRTMTPQIFLVDPVTKSSVVIHEASQGGDSIFGLAEVEPDVFVFTVGYYSLTTGPQSGSYSAWSLDLSEYESTQAVTVAKIANVPDAALLNGVCQLSPTSSKVLMTDSANGVVFALDYKTGEYEPSMAGGTLVASQSATLDVGVNGIKTYDGFAFYTNSGDGKVYRVAIDEDGRSTDEPVFLADVTSDDLWVSHDGRTVYAAAVFSNEVVAIDVSTGETRVIAGRPDSLTVAEPTAVAQGRTTRDQSTLYVTTTGGMFLSGEGEATTSKLLAIEIAQGDVCY